jgi:HAD superfamily hydrolase (TIGR01544 family)
MSNTVTVNITSGSEAHESFPHIIPDKWFNTRIVIRNKEEFHEKLTRFQAGGVEKLSVISDFDYTMSKFHKSNGERSASCHKVLEDCDFINPLYKLSAQALQKKYYPLEVDPTLEEEERIRYMIEWVEKAHELLLQYGLTRNTVQLAVDEAITNQRIALRSNLLDFIKVIHFHKIPLLIFSAGIGDILQEVLRWHLPEIVKFPEIYVISNHCIWSDEERTMTKERTTDSELAETNDSDKKHHDHLIHKALEATVTQHNTHQTEEDRSSIPYSSSAVMAVNNVKKANNELKGFSLPVIHVFNKKSTFFLETPYFTRTDSSQRQNIVLIGDSLGDITMTEGMIDIKDPENVLKIGFLNDRIERLPSYLKVFDIIILDDPGFDVPLGILHLLCGENKETIDEIKAVSLEEAEKLSKWNNVEK